jgi:hypothetical protein
MEIYFSAEGSYAVAPLNLIEGNGGEDVTQKKVIDSSVA